MRTFTGSQNTDKATWMELRAEFITLGAQVMSRITDKDKEYFDEKSFTWMIRSIAAVCNMFAMMRGER